MNLKISYERNNKRLWIYLLYFYDKNNDQRVVQWSSDYETVSPAQSPAHVEKLLNAMREAGEILVV